jgi:cytochrome c
LFWAFGRNSVLAARLEVANRPRVRITWGLGWEEWAMTLVVRLDWGRRLVAALAACLLVGFGAVAAEAVEKDQTAKGEALVKENCSRCHAIGKEGASPHPDAPPFRTLSSKYPIEDLAESLAEGIVSGHPDMPIFVFSPTDVAAIIDYLNSIQDQPAPVEEPD